MNSDHNEDKFQYMDREEFRREQEHLSDVYIQLQEKKEAAKKRIEELSAQVADEKKVMRDDYTINFATDDDTIETWGELEVMNHNIDRANIEADAAGDKIRKLNKLLETPYFARVRLQFSPEEEPEDYDIGIAGMEKDGYDQLIIDWRSPIAETYYNQDNGKTFYTVNGNRVDVDLLLRRQFDLHEDQLNSYFDTTLAIQDPMLLQSLSKRRNDRMQAITVTIQKEQNELIRYSDVPVLLVNGIAGSGKTSVLLQRIAYLFYQKRRSLDPQNVYLLTLNPVFGKYISDVLPEMGERNPVTLTWADFLDMVEVPGKHDPGYETTRETLEKIDALLPSFQLEKEDFNTVWQGDMKVLTPEQIARTIAQYPDIPTSVRLIQVTVDALIDKAKFVLKTKEDNIRENEGAGLPDLSKEDRLESARTQSKFGGAYQMIEKCGWLNIERIGTRLLGKDRLTSVEWYYLKMALTGECERSAQYVMIDEVQDYTLAQLMVLERYFANARFMLLGDEFQAIHEGRVKFSEIHDFFDAKKKRVTELPLMTSYRSSPEITELFTSLLPKERSVLTSSVQRPGVVPVIEAADSREAYTEKLRTAVTAARKESGLTAIVCAGRPSIDRVTSLLGQDAPKVLRVDEALPKEGAFIIDLGLVKGLEFDGVIIPDADEKNYPDTELSRHRLYTAESRATQRLTILAEGKLTPLVSANT
jgi:DNA helicase-2/ATP-dependent DNA helicase PcrA